ncbi:MAG: hypothetical protein ABJG47_20490 [Ekhidna sp.]
MGKKLCLRFLKISLLIALSFTLEGQQLEETNSISLKQPPSSYSIDFQGNLYVGFDDGRLSKYDAHGRFLENFSLSNNSSITLIDVQNNLRAFLFYFDIQQVTILDRFSSVPKNYPLSDFSLEISMMACPSPDGDFWIIENNPQRLKKINPLRKATVLEAQISIGNTIRRMQAYQNILVIGDESGLHLFDSFGGIVQTIPIENLIDFHIAGGQLYAFTANQILEINPFKGVVNATIDQPKESKMLLKSRNGFVSVLNKKLTFYESASSER